jgi:L-amino acid N-acyltransferase YncA
MQIVACHYDTHAAPILAILNDAIVTWMALLDYRPRDPDSMIEWFRAKDARRFPVLGAVAADGAHGLRDLRHVPCMGEMEPAART